MVMGGQGQGQGQGQGVGGGGRGFVSLLSLTHHILITPSVPHRPLPHHKRQSEKATKQKKM